MADLPKQGDTANVTHPAGIGVGFGAVPAGTELTVTDVVDAGTPGVGDLNEDTVRIEFDEPGLVLDDNGYPKQGTIRRAMSLSLSQFRDLTKAN